MYPGLKALEGRIKYEEDGDKCGNSAYVALHGDHVV